MRVRCALMTVALLAAALPVFGQSRNGPYKPPRPGATLVGGAFNSVVGSKVGTTNTLTYVFTITGTTNDSGGNDTVQIQIWDDGTMVTSKSYNIPVGSTQVINDTLTWTGAIGSVIPGIGVDLIDTPGGTNLATLDPFFLTNEQAFQLSKVGPVAAFTGDTITYTITYGNTTASAITDVVIRDTVPSGTTFVSATGGGTLSAGVVTWNIGTIPANTQNLTVSFSVTVTASAGSFVRNSTYSISGTGATTVNGTPTSTSIGLAVPTMNLWWLAGLAVILLAGVALRLRLGRAS